MKGYIISHDIGTTGNKATLFDISSGTIKDKAFVPYDTFYPYPGWAEQDPEGWWDAVVKSTQILLSRNQDAIRHIEAIGCSGQMMGCLPVDGRGVPLLRSIIHADIRSLKQVDLIGSELGRKRIYGITGNVLDPHYPLPKILWLKENEPEIYRKARFFLQSKDYITFRMTGILGYTDPSDASLTAMWDIKRREWSDEILSFLGMGRGMVPTVVPSSHVLGGLKGDVASIMGLPSGIPVVVGGGDGASATIGAGLVSQGKAYNYIGGTSWIATLSPEPLLDPGMRVFHFADMQEGWVDVVGTVQCAGSSYDWFIREIGEKELKEAESIGTSPYLLMDEVARRSPPGARGLFFLPYLMGERTPIWDPFARGVFFGLTLAHKKEDLARAVLEGVAYALNSILDVLQELGGPIESVTVIGGGARGTLWREIMADVYGKRILVPDNIGEATSYGAAIAAGVGIGVFEGFEVAERYLKIVAEHIPDEDRSRRYRGFYEFYLSLYPKMKDLFQSLHVLLSQE